MRGQYHYVQENGGGEDLKGGDDAHGDDAGHLAVTGAGWYADGSVVPAGAAAVAQVVRAAVPPPGCLSPLSRAMLPRARARVPALALCLRSN